MGLQRLDQLLAKNGLGTRSQVKKLIRAGAVCVNGSAASPEMKVDPEKDEVVCQGRRIGAALATYVMMNKPMGVISATKDEKLPTVIDLLKEIPNAQKLFPAGRLDIDTTGLLLLTDDGVLSHKLLSPRSHVEKEYIATLERPVTPEDVMSFKEGMDIGDEKKTLPAVLEALPDSDGTKARVILHEGRFHQVKRMIEKTGNKVTALKRVRMGSLILDEELEEGAYRKLTPEEVRGLTNQEKTAAK